MLDLPHDFGRYTLTDLIGEGGMAEVYLSWVRVAEGLSKRVVVKKIRREFAEHQEFMRMFVDEAKIALSLNHANIVQVFDFGQEGVDFYLAMEHVEGIDLMRLYHGVRRAGDSFPPVIAAYIVHQVAAGLAYAHRKTDELGQPLGIVHRDVSPHNVMVSFEGQVKILDFGIARTQQQALVRAPPEQELRESGPESDAETIKGKVAYMSPEQAHGRPVDPRSDVYSAGVVLHELISGRLLYRTRDRLAALDQVRNEPVSPLLHVAPDAPPELAEIVDRCLARDAEERYPSARALQADLAAFLHAADPVVDDEVLSNFVAQYHREPTPTADPMTVDPSSVGPGAASASATPPPPDAPRKRQQRVVVVWVALEPRRDDETGTVEHVPDPRPFVGLARDVAFKRDALVLRDDDRAIVLAFGTLLRTGDDAERALRTALALREEAGETAPGLRLGFVIASAGALVERDESGFVHVQLRPGAQRQLERIGRRYMEGPVMVTGSLIESLSASWSFGDGGFVDAGATSSASGGIDRELEHVSPLLGPSREVDGRVTLAPGGRNVLFGRELELKTLRDAFADVIRRRQSRSALVIGEPGLGKRALVERFVASMPRSACWVLRASGSWSRRNVPFGAFLDLLARFLEIDHDISLEELTRKLDGFGVREAGSLAAMLAQALGVRAAESVGRGLDPGRRRDRLWSLVRRLIIGLARRRPVLVLIENIHLHDEQSVMLLREWVQGTQPYPVLGLVTGRPGNRRVEMVRRETGVAEIRLRELDPRARRDMIVRRFEDPSAAEPLAQRILAQTGGNPMFIEQTLASLLERGVIGWNPQGRFLALLRPDAPIELPRSIEAALQERLSDLPRDDQEVLQAAAILGRAFRPSEVEGLVGRAVERALDQLAGRGFVEAIEGASRPAETMRFATVSLHEAAKASIASDTAAALHGHCAKLRRGRPDYASERDDGPIADHLAAAGLAHDAIAPALSAAATAHEIAGNREAYYYLSLALRALDEDDPRRFEALLRRERILRAWGRRREQVADIRRLLTTAEALDDDDRRGIASLRLMRFYVEIGRGAQATRLLPRIEARIAAVQNPRPYFAVLHELRSELSFLEGNFADAEHFARNGLPFCGPDTRGRRQRSRLLRSLGQVLNSEGRFAEARQAYEEALVLARRIENPRLEANILNALGEVAGRSTRYQEAVDYFKAALAIDRELGDRYMTGRKLANLGITYGAIGLHRRAERYLRKALELHEAVGHRAEFNDAIVHLGDVVAHLGQLESAVLLLQDAAEVARGRRDPRTELRARVRLADALAREGGDAARAKSIAQEVLDASRAQGLRTSRRRALCILARLAEQAGEIDVAIELEREAVNLVRAGADPLSGVISIHHLGRLLVGTGRNPEGVALLEEAATKVQARLDDLRDDDLRRGYLELADAREILSAVAHAKAERGAG